VQSRFFANFGVKQTARSFGFAHLHSVARSSLGESPTQLKYHKRSATIAEATAEQKKGPAHIMSAEVRNCWQKPEWQREPAKYTWSNTRKTRSSKRNQKPTAPKRTTFLARPMESSTGYCDANREDKSQVTKTAIALKTPEVAGPE
jgi:hypothetical protein